MIEGDNTPSSPVGENVDGRSHALSVSVFVFILMTLLLAMVGYVWVGTLAPSHPAQEVTLTIPEGSTVGEIGRTLMQKGVIRNATIFGIAVQLKGLDTSLPAGEFRFKTPRDLSLVIAQLSGHDHGIARVRITIPEGLRVAQMIPILSVVLPDFDREEFYAKAKAKEGYLFPDTYFFFASATSGPVLTTLEENFLTKTKDLHDESVRLQKPWADIIIMASIIEEEAVGDRDRRMVSGILWNRIQKGMRLQVDASFAYLLNKASSEITVDDLNSDSPYNTYRYAGLPPGPIANPGIAAIDAALHPTPSTYLYYLSDADGVMHYAKTFEEHKLNKAKYLR